MINKISTYKKRFVQIKKILDEYNIDSILIFGNYHDNKYLRWSCGYRPLLFSYLYIDKNNIILYDIDYLIEIAKKSIKYINILPISEDNTDKDILNICKKNNCIGIVGDIPYKHIKDINCNIVDISYLFDQLILYKSDIEIQYIKKSAQILSKCFKKISSYIKVNTNVINLEQKLRINLLQYAENLAFPISISAGEMLKKTTVNFPQNYVLKKDDYVCIDAGIVKDGFASDMTRCYFLQNTKIQKYYKSLKLAHYEVINCVKKNMYLYDIVNLYYEKLKKYNLPYNTLAVADLGHSIGFYVHEIPFVYDDKYKNFKLDTNMIFALEPEITVDGYKIRIEDMILINKNKNIVLTL